jgi:hypothetical protein
VVLRRLLPVGRYTKGFRGWVFAPGGWWKCRCGAGADEMVDHWQVVRPLAGCWPAGGSSRDPLTGCSPTGGLLGASGRTTGYREPTARPGSAGGRRGVHLWGPRTPSRGCDGRWRCGCGDLGHRMGTWYRSFPVRGPDLVSEAPPCAPVERPGRRDLLRWCTRCRFRGVPLPFRAGQLPEGPGKATRRGFRAEEVPEGLRGGGPPALSPYL